MANEVQTEHMDVEISHEVYSTQPITIAADVANSETIKLRGLSGGGFVLPATVSGISQIDWYVSYDNVSFFPLYDRVSQDAPVQLHTSIQGANGEAHPFPDELYGFPFVRGEGDAADVIYPCIQG